MKTLQKTIQTSLFTVKPSYKQRKREPPIQSNLIIYWNEIRQTTTRNTESKSERRGSKEGSIQGRPGGVPANKSRP